MQEENKKQDERYHKRRRIFLFIWFFFLTIFLSTITYAWFSSNRIADLQFFDIHVETDGGLEISENAIDWKGELTVDELKMAYKTYPSSLNQVPGIMKPVSSGGDVDGNGYLNVFYGQADSNGTNNYYLTAYRKIEQRTTEMSNEGDFIVFDVFFKTSTPKPLYLSKESYVRPKEGETKGIENSARIAFIYEGNAPTETDITTIQRMKKANGKSIIWEPNYDVHTAHGVSNARSLYGIETTTTNAGILRYDGVVGTVTNTAKVDIRYANSTNYPNLFERVKVDIYTKSAYNDNNYLFDLEPGITKLRIYMWLEGQDVDSENRASQGDISYKIQFTLNP